MNSFIGAFDVVRQFEQTVANFAGSKYGVAVDTCTAALFLSCVYCKVQEVTIPKHTYVSVPCSIIQAGGSVKFEDLEWRGNYQLKPYPIIDSALRFKRDMYIKDTYYCVSFHYKKPLPIGRGGMILTDDEKAVDWLKQARFMGRHESPILEDRFEMLGWNMYMEPERAAKGLQLMLYLDKDGKEMTDIYPDLSKFPIYTKK
jgi:dTDP-4-amino-4,6-dideoxygalactose transaminase